MEPDIIDASGGDQPVGSWRSKRITKACDVCYEKKIKCDGAVPQCNWCAHRGLQCSYERRVVRKRRSNKQHRNQLLDRVDRLERLLAKTLEQKTAASLPHDSLSDPSDSTTDISLNREDDGNDEVRDFSTPSSIEHPALGSLHFAGWRLGSINSTNGIPVFSEHGEQWIRSRTGEDASTERITALRQSWCSMICSDSGTSVNVTNANLPINLPDRQVVDHCLALYHHSFVCYVFPVVDPVLFQNTIATAYSPTPSHSTHDLHNVQACIFAFLAFTSFFGIFEPTKITSNADRYLLTAHRMLTEFSLPVTLETLQTSIMLMMCHVFSGDIRNALFQDCVTARIIYLLGAHVATYPSCTDASVISANPSLRERYLMRNVFWMTYIVDKELSLRTGQPPSLQDENCDLTLPTAHVQLVYLEVIQSGTGMSSRAGNLFPGHPSLSIIKSKAYTALFSTRALRKTDAEILRDIRELDDDLECWRLSIPPPYRPTVSFTRARPPTNVEVMPSVMLHLDYNHFVATIHQATSRCRAWSFGNQDEMEGVGTSLELSIEASRSSLVYLEMTSHLLDENSFWFIIYYPISALLTLFYGILHRPLSPQSRKDLELLKGVPPTIRKIPMGRLIENAARPIQAIDKLVEELSSLAQCAIDKATQDNMSQYTD